MQKKNKLKNLIWICVTLLFCLVPVKAVNANEAAKTIKVGYYDEAAFHAGQDDDAIKSGYGYEYYNMISNYTGWKFEYYYGTWTTVYEAFLRGEIDIIDDVCISSDREKVMDFTTLPMGEEHYYIYIPEADESINSEDVKTLNAKRIGVENRTINQQILAQFLAKSGIKCEVVECYDWDEMLEKMANGELDAIVDTNGFEDEGYKIAFIIGEKNIYFAVKKNRPELLEPLNDAMRQIHDSNPEYNNTLANKYFRKNKARTTLSDEESAFLAEHSTIRMGYIKDCLPFSGQDSVTGEMVGLIKDVCDRFERTLHITIERVPYDSKDAMIAAIDSGEIDCAYPVMDNVWLSEQLGYTQTSPLSLERMALIYKGEYRGKGQYKRIGYTIGYPAQEEYIYTNNIDVTGIGYKTVQQTVAALQRGEIDGILMNSLGWNYYCRNNQGCDNLYSIYLDDNVGYVMAVKKDETYLFSSLNTAISKLDSGVIVEALNRYANTKTDYTLRNFILYNRTTFILVAIIMFLVMIMALSYYEKNKSQKKQLAYDANHDPLTGVLNRSIMETIDRKLKKNVCLAIIDIDNFKHVNDENGHERGDAVIRFVAEVLQSEIRTGDILVRYGGDEFLVIMDDITRTSASIVEKRFGLIKERMKLSEAEGLPLVTLSIGIAFSEDGYSQELFDRADAALYQAKDEGKDRYKINYDR